MYASCAESQSGPRVLSLAFGTDMMWMQGKDKLLMPMSWGFFTFRKCLNKQCPGERAWYVNIGQYRPTPMKWLQFLKTLEDKMQGKTNKQTRKTPHTTKKTRS